MARNRESLPRLNIPQPLNLQQPVSYPDNRGQQMFSPALPTSIQQGFHPPFPIPGPLQTPMQPFFNPQQPPPPGRPSHHHQPSVAQLAAAGIHPPNGFPIPSLPSHGHFPRPSLALAPGQLLPGQPAGPPFPHRNRRQPSIGGPPKAVLGGPARKLNPPPVGAPVGPTATLNQGTTPAPATKKKVNINLPKETVPGEEGQPPTRPSWARAPLDNPVSYDDSVKVPPVETSTREVFPPDQWRLGIPPAIDVFLPGKVAWDTIKQKVIEEKLEKLGVEKGSGSNVPHIFAPHARAASISSPADPALLLFKLNKLQQAQDSAANSLSASPQPPASGLTPSPRVPGAPAPRFLTNGGPSSARHGYSMSLAQPPTGHNPFGPSAVLGSDQPLLRPPSAGSRPDSRPDFIRGFGVDIPEEPEEEERAATEADTEDGSDEDEAEGSFEEHEEDANEEEGRSERYHRRKGSDAASEMTGDVDFESTDDEAGTQRERDNVRGSNVTLTTEDAESRVHSRHVSKLSAALTLRSVGGVRDSESRPHSRQALDKLFEHSPRVLPGTVEREGEDEAPNGRVVERERRGVEEDERAIIGEWTGSEDMYYGTSEDEGDDQSIGDYSNPSDEERARQQRAQRRSRQHRMSLQIDDIPRRLPNFPRPPDNTMVVPPPSHAHHHSQYHVQHHHVHHASTFRRPPHHMLPVQQQYAQGDEEDIISNPSDEQHTRNGTSVYLGVEQDYYVPSRPSSGLGRPLPPLPQESHSRVHSAQLSSHDPARAHSRVPSAAAEEEDRFVYPGAQAHEQVFHPPQAEVAPVKKDALNPNAKPFVFGIPSPAPATISTPAVIAIPTPSFAAIAPETTYTNGSAADKTITPDVVPGSPLLAPIPAPVQATASTPAPAAGKPPKAPLMGHSRLPSVGKPLNVSAPEFKPVGFTFRPPPGVPQMPQPVSFPIPDYGQSPYEPVGGEDGAPEAEGHRYGSLLNPGGYGAQKPESPFRVQGREKRQRVGSGGVEGGDEEDAMASFRFPNNLDSPASILRTVNGGGLEGVKSPTPGAFGLRHERSQSSVDRDRVVEPFVYARQEEEDKESERQETIRRKQKESEDEEAANRSRLQEFTYPPSASKPKRAPIPLDFKTNNTVPAGVFKALAANSNSGPPSIAGAEDKTLPRRSRPSSNDLFEHSGRPSMDDVHVPAIARKTSRLGVAGAGDAGNNSLGLATSQSRRESMDDMDVFGVGSSSLLHRHRHSGGSRHRYDRDRHGRRRSSLPDSLHDSISDLEREGLRLGVDLERLEGLLDEKIAGLKEYLVGELEGVKEEVVNHQQLQQRQLQHQHHSTKMNGDAVGALALGAPKGALSSSTEAMITEVVTLFRAQLEQSAARGLEEMDDARGEMDFQLIKDIVEQGHRESLTLLRKELDEVIDRLWQLRTEELNAADRQAKQQQQQPQKDWTPVIEQAGNKTIQAVVESISELQTRLESINRNSASRERDAIVDRVVAALTPTLTSIRAEPLDYEFLTTQLAQAVKPHISQLIDLAADKRETAGLIVEKLVPILPTLGSARSAAVDTEALTSHLTTEIRRAIGPIDAFEIKEGVADLVVERLDSRLAVRDRALNAENVSGKVVEGVGKLMMALESVVVESVGKVAKEQEKIRTEQNGLGERQEKARVAVEKQVLDGVKAIVEELKETKALVVQQGERALPAPEPIIVKDENVALVKNGVDGLVESHKVLERNGQEILVVYKDILERLNTLPGSLATATTVLQDSHADFISNREKDRTEMEELRRANTELQVQLSKARGAHGQIRVEKDVLGERFAAVEAERERLRAQVRELQENTGGAAEQIRGLESRNSELEQALSKALERNEAADVASEESAAKVKDLEQANKELNLERHSLKSKVNALELQVAFVNREKDATAANLATMQKQYDILLAEQGHWDELRQASEKIDMLTTLISQADTKELEELRQYRDRTKTLEAEHSALQKRFKDQEAKITNNERVAFTARQSLSQAQQRASEWERRAKEYEGQLESVQVKLEQSEQINSQLEADYSVVKLQLEDFEADDRLSKDRETKLREQVAGLEGQVARLQAELEQARLAPPRPPTRSNTKTPTAVIPPPTSFRGGASTPSANGYATRPDSRASAIHNERSTSRLTHYSSNGTSTPPASKPSVWDSMHAPPSANAYQSLANSYSMNNSRNGRYPNLGPTNAPRTRKVHPSYLQRSVAPPSPTPSTVSLTPTQGEDGWWS